MTATLRVNSLQKKIVPDVLQGSATDLSGAFADESPTTRIRECGTKENTTQLNSVIVALCLIIPSRHYVLIHKCPLRFSI